MKNLQELISICNGSVTISVNGHKDCYESVEQFITEDYKEDIDKHVLLEMINRDVIIEIQAYPRTPVGFFTVYHYDINEAINTMLDIVKNDLN